MSAILEKIRADITSRPLISLLIISTIVAAAALLTLALTTLMNVSAPYDTSFRELNGAHLWLYFRRDRVRLRDINRIESLPGVVDSTGLQYSIDSQVRVGDNRVETSLRAMPDEMPAVSQLLLQQGRYLAARQIEVLANEELNYYYHLKVGDTVSIKRSDGKEMSLPVIGLAYNPTWDIYRNSQPSYLYVTEETLRELFPDETSWDWSIGLRLADPQSVDMVVAEIKSRLRSDAIESHTDWRDVRTSATFEGQLYFVFLGAFSIFAIIATMLVVASSISSMVLSQFKQIGMLKAIGFTQNQILVLYLGQYFALSIIGSLLGLLLGLALAPIPLESVAVSLNTTFRPSLSPALVGLVFSVITGVVVLATLGAAYRGAKANIIKAIATGAESPRQSFWGVSLANALGLSMTFVLGLNDVFARPLRSFLTGLNLTLGVTGIVFGLALNETLDAYMADPSLMGVVYDAVVTRNGMSDSRTQHWLQRAPGVEAFYGEYTVEAETLQGQEFQVRAVSGNMAAFSIKVSQGRFIRPGTYEALAGQGLLNWLGLEVGEDLTLILDDKTRRPITWRIVGQYIESSNAGQMLIVDLPSTARAIGRVKPDTYYLKLYPGVDPGRLKLYLEPDRDATLSVTLIKQTVPDNILYLQAAIFALAVILISIALVNVFNTSLVTVQEKLKIIGVLKTMGMTPGQIVLMVSTTAGFLGIVATGFGVPLGLAFTRGMLAGLSYTYGIGEVAVTVNFLHILLLIPLVVGISMVGGLIPAQQAARISIVQVLRHE